MLRTSRCIAGILFQLGGPDALQAVERFLHLCLGNFSSRRSIRHLSEKLFRVAIARRLQPRAHILLFNAINKSGPSAHNLRGEVAACCVAVG